MTQAVTFRKFLIFEQDKEMDVIGFLLAEQQKVSLLCLHVRRELSPPQHPGLSCSTRWGGLEQEEMRQTLCFISKLLDA